MHPLLKKLNVKTQSELYVLNAPAEFKNTLIEWEQDDLGPAVSTVLPAQGQLPFLLCFVTEQEALNQAINQIAPYIKGEQETLLWFAYPKKSSKKYKSNINRDHGWDALGSLGYEPVRQVAIDEDWSALRFRPVANIARFTRNQEMAISEEGRKKTAPQYQGGE